MDPQKRFDTQDDFGGELPPFRDWMRHAKLDEFDFRRADMLLLQAGRRADANETALFARALEYVKAQTYDVRYSRMRVRELCPIDTSAPDGVKTITYESWDEVREARIVANAADDLPNVEVFATEHSSKVVTIGTAYQWSVEDLMRAAMSGKSIDTRRARAAQRAIEQKIDDIGTSGDASAGLTGLINNPNVPDVAPTTAGAWSGLSALNILKNLHNFVRSIVTTTKGIHQPNVLVMDEDQHSLISTTVMSADNTQTILEAFLKNDPFVQRVEIWTKLKTAGAGGAPLLLAYELSDDVLQFNIPVPMMQLPPQPRNLAFVVPMMARVGGVEMHYPKAVAYQTID